ncbi:hypothetical protein EVAR_102284_1 [Eumeta japonica]|uniref:Uncharacterized protein n=1 Tax=Eumeta variegata TaxID=151549 RepID=A0A4C1WJM9_EUMVA|nr:hypothetical protein EVAR_102284_1 [Eumeta japonica]
MAGGGLRAAKRPRRDNDHDHDHEQNQESNTAPASPVHDAPIPRAPDADYDDDDGSGDESSPASTVTTTFSMTDFDLDAKIRALPALSFDHFLLRKRESKRKKRTQHANLDRVPPTTTLMSPRPPPPAIGSQKRKPRKISITRLEVNSLTATAPRAALEAPAAAEAAPRGADPCPASSPGDMLALATLAEVAAIIRHHPLPH